MRCLGRTPSRRDPRTLRLARYLDSRLPSPPLARDWGRRMTRPWGAMRNHEIGCCTIAGLAHLLQLWTVNSSKPGGQIVSVRDAAVVEAYSAISGYRPGDPSTDRGASMIDALNHWRNVGVDGHKITAYARVDHRNRDQVMIAANLFGGLYVGANLPAAARGAAVWSVPRSVGGKLDGDHAPGTWGPHAMTLAAYDRSSVWFVTWGMLIRASWPWVFEYVDEVYAVLGPAWADGEPAPHGFAFDELRDDLARIG